MRVVRRNATPTPATPATLKRRAGALTTFYTNETIVSSCRVRSSFDPPGTRCDWGPLMAGATLCSLPVIIFFLLVQRKIAFGLTAGAVKG